MPPISTIPRRPAPDPASVLNKPAYELRATGLPGLATEMSIWQVPCEATPSVKSPIHYGTIRGPQFEAASMMIHRHLRAFGHPPIHPRKGELQRHEVHEDLAMFLGVLFRVLAPMRNVKRMAEVAAGIDEMRHEEHCYWLGMAMHRRNQRRTLAALRMLLTSK